MIFFCFLDLSVVDTSSFFFIIWRQTHSLDLTSDVVVFIFLVLFRESFNIDFSFGFLSKAGLYHSKRAAATPNKCVKIATKSSNNPLDARQALIASTQCSRRYLRAMALVISGNDVLRKMFLPPVTYLPNKFHLTSVRGSAVHGTVLPFYRKDKMGMSKSTAYENQGPTHRHMA
jgi:hypothetical protein